MLDSNEFTRLMAWTNAMSNGPPYLLAIVFGLVVSATLYMLFVWPRVEPPDDDPEPSDEPPASDPPAP